MDEGSNEVESIGRAKGNNDFTECFVLLDETAIDGVKSFASKDAKIGLTEESLSIHQ
jgi:hypothetical protein